MTEERFALFIKFLTNYLSEVGATDIAYAMMRALQDLQNTPES